MIMKLLVITTIVFNVYMAVEYQTRGYIRIIIFNPQKTIVKNIKKDYPNEKITSDAYINLERILIKNLKKNNKSDLNEIRFDIDMRLQHVEVTDFDKFVGIRLSYYAVVLAIIAIILSSNELINELTFDIKYLISGIIIFMIFMLISHNIMSNIQRERLIYYRFKLQCIDKIIAERENSKTK